MEERKGVRGVEKGRVLHPTDINHIVHNASVPRCLLQ